MKLLRKSGLGVFLLAIAASTQAGPTYEQVEKFLEDVKIPEWRNLSYQVSSAKWDSQDKNALKIWQELDSEVDNTTGKTPLEKVMKSENDKDVSYKIAWLRWKVIGENSDPRYSYAYASALSSMKDRKGDLIKEAAIFRWHAQLALKIDGARCVDQTRPQNIAVSYESQPQIQQLIKRIEQMSAKDKAITQLEAIALERARGERQPFGGLCTSGNLARSEAIKNGGVSTLQIKEIDKKSEQLKDVKIGAIEVDTSEIEPKYIDYSQWQHERLGILNRLTAIATENL